MGVFAWLWNNVVVPPFAAIGNALAWLVDVAAGGSALVLVAELVAVVAVAFLVSVARERYRTRGGNRK